MYGEDNFSYARYKDMEGIVISVFLLFMLFCHVCMMNLLIAMMSNTYDNLTYHGPTSFSYGAARVLARLSAASFRGRYTEIMDNVEKEFVFPYARIILYIEQLVHKVLPLGSTIDLRYGARDSPLRIPAIGVIARGTKRLNCSMCGSMGSRIEQFSR